MKRTLIGTVIGLIVGIGTGVGAAHIFDASDVSYNPQDESWNVNNANEAIESLKTDLENSKNDINGYKENIAESLTNIGIETNENSNIEEIKSGINNLNDKMTYGDATAEDLLIGKKALVNGKEIVGKYDSSNRELKKKTISIYSGQSGFTFEQQFELDSDVILDNVVLEVGHKGAARSDSFLLNVSIDGVFYDSKGSGRGPQSTTFVSFEGKTLLLSKGIHTLTCTLSNNTDGENVFSGAISYYK